MPTVTPRIRVPSYRRHRPSGQAVVTIAGRDIYLGKWGTAASRVEYQRLIGEWLAAGGTLPSAQHDLTVAELCQQFYRHAAAYYVKDGQPTTELAEYRLMLRLLRQRYGHTLARDFGPLALKAVREAMVAAGWTRGVVNQRTYRIKRVFRWAVADELIPPTVYQALSAVEGLKRGRTAAAESSPIEPVADEVVDATLPHLPPIVADLVRLQRLTGCRPGELCILRPMDVDRGVEIWLYRPESHKTQHHGRQRSILIGPKAQQVLARYLLRDASAYCFDPRESESQRNAIRREHRQTPMTPSQAKRRPKRHPKRTAGDRYTNASYRRAIARGVEKANAAAVKAALAAGQRPKDAPQLPDWHPHQLRHSAATEIRREFGLEAAQVVLGHATANITQVYAQRDLALAAEVVRKIG